MSRLRQFFLSLPAAMLLASCATTMRPAHLDPSRWDEWLLPTHEVGASPQPQASRCRLFVRELGRGPDQAVFLHGGWGGEHSDLLEGFQPLARELRLTFYDQRGSLRSPCDSLPTLTDHIEDLERLRQALGRESLVLVGHSMGTHLAMAYAARFPDRVAGMLLLAPVWPTASPPDGPPIGERWMRPAVRAELERHGLDLDRRREDGPLGWAINHRIIFAAVNLHDITRWNRVRPPWDYNDRVAASTARSVPADHDYRPTLSRLAVPILILQGDDDFLPQATWADALPNVRREVVPRAGHNLWVDRPEVVLPRVRAFAREVAANRP